MRPLNPREEHRPFGISKVSSYPWNFFKIISQHMDDRLFTSSCDHLWLSEPSAPQVGAHGYFIRIAGPISGQNQGDLLPYSSCSKNFAPVLSIFSHGGIWIPLWTSGGLDGAFCREMASTKWRKKIGYWGKHTATTKWTRNTQSIVLEIWTSYKMVAKKKKKTQERKWLQNSRSWM